MAKQRTITLVKQLGPPQAPVAYRIVIEGLAYGDASHVKARAMDEIHTALIAGSGVTGAQVIYVTTLRGVNNGKITIRGAEKDTTSLARSARPGTSRNPIVRVPEALGDVGLNPRTGKPYIRGPQKNPRGSRGRSVDAATGKRWDNVVRAIRSQATRHGWTDAQYEAEVERRRAGGKPRRFLGWGERAAIGDVMEGGRMIAAGSSKRKAGRPLGSKDSVPRRKKRRRAPRGLGPPVEVLPNGTRIYADGSRITPSGRRLTAEGVKAMQQTAANAREARKHPAEAPSFPEPPVVVEVEPQEAFGPTPIQPIPGEEHRAFQRWSRMLGITKQTPAPKVESEPRGDLPVERPDIPAGEWDVIVTHWLEPDTDPVALCHNYRITRAQLDHELEARGIRPYAQAGHQVYDKVTLAPPRQH